MFNHSDKLQIGLLIALPCLISLFYRLIWSIIKIGCSLKEITKQSMIRREKQQKQRLLVALDVFGSEVMHHVVLGGPLCTMGCK